MSVLRHADTSPGQHSGSEKSLKEQLPTEFKNSNYRVVGASDSEQKSTEHLNFTTRLSQSRFWRLSLKKRARGGCNLSREAAVI